MLIFVYGDDTFRVQEKVRQMIKAFREKFDPSGLNVSEYSFEGTKKGILGEILGSARTLPFFGKKRMIIVRQLISEVKTPEVQAWVTGFIDLPESSIVIFWETLEPKALEKRPLFKKLSEIAEVHSYTFPQLHGSALNKWVQIRLKERGAIMETEALSSLVERVGPDLWRMDQEIGKLVAYAHDKPITLEMVQKLVHENFEGKIFTLIDAISQRHPLEAFRLLQEERLSGTDDHYLLTMLGRQVRILLGIRAMLEENTHVNKQEIAQTLGIHPFVAQKGMSQAHGFTLDQLKRVHDLLFQFDYQLKTGHLDAQMAVDLTTIELIHS
ncbi:MAG: polymerase III subunit delta protein [Candidatus Uhrbacteria bacterium GW2011_GWF2_39_13]|uniref:DNA polymerase III subunit delta n=1 Tax=Candidatus Uhrbacteria bacterium GW2011_GWF2_39_13 TaxID=1618995 RepID=A0A0G0QRR2_9BACT|nr:MAG: polymerase III subunit delta protein [Candidatus Uhrbacteria bacterium GW2011_GWF2_39_13]HAU66535.1 DNA polymerase III subunit delta [Candidatus Uhrbacteria bacterium]